VQAWSCGDATRLSIRASANGRWLEGA
jgi:hypothetical protein